MCTLNICLGILYDILVIAFYYSTCSFIRACQKKIEGIRMNMKIRNCQVAEMAEEVKTFISSP